MSRTRIFVVTAVVALAGLFFLYPDKTPQPSSSENADTRREVRIGTEGAYPPFNFIDAKGELQGFDIDITNAICAELNFRCEFVAQDWDGLIPGLLTHKYDAIAASMSITADRKKAVAFTDRYYRTPIRFVARRDSPLIVSEEGLTGRTIGVQRATTSAIYLKKKYGDAVTVRYYDTQENAYLDLVAGRIDTLLADAIHLVKWLETEEGKPFDFRGETIYVDEGIGIAMRKSDQELLQAFNEGLARIQASGMYDKISEKYFPFSIY